MRRHFIGPANIFPPLACERLEDRSVLSVAGLGAIGAADEPAEAIPCEETPDEAILSEESDAEVPPVEEWNWDESWVTEDEFLDESGVPVEENFDESGVPVEENFDESWVPVEENFDGSWVPVEENFDESWAPVEENFDESWAPDGTDWIWRCGMTGPIGIPDASDESIYFTAMAAGGIPVPASPAIAESAGPLVAVPNSAEKIAVADAALVLPPESAPNKPFVVQELAGEPQAESIVVPPPPAAIVPDQSAENSAELTFSVSATSDDHISSAESLELSVDLPVG